MEPNTNQISKYKVLPQILAGVSSSLAATVVGGWVSFPSVAVPQLYEEEGPMKVDQFGGSWIVSLFYIGTVFGGFSGAILNQHFGPKNVFLWTFPLAACTWIGTALADRLWILYVMRILSGFLFGVYQANSKVYNAEISHPDLRGTMGTLIGIMFGFGRLYTYVVSYVFASWRMLAWLELAPVCIFFMCACFIPTSPYWLVEKGKNEEARKALVWLRGSQYCVNDELEEIINKKREKENRQVNTNIASAILSMAFIRPFLRVGTLLLIVQWGGVNVITTYMVDIFKMSGSSIDPTLAPIFVTSIQLALATCSALVLRVAPRKPLFIFSCLGISVAQITMGVYSYLALASDSSTVDPVNIEGPYGWVPMVCVIAVSSFQVFGVLVVVQLLLAECFPTEIRSYASGICGALAAVNTFGATKLFPSLQSLMGFHGTFWLYGGVMFFSAVFGALCIPENRGESLVKTEDKFQSARGTENEATPLLRENQEDQKSPTV